MALRRYIIERDIPKVGTFEREQLRGAAAKSNEVLRQLGADIQWVESFVAADKTFCVYLAEDEPHGDQRFSRHQDHRGPWHDRSDHRARQLARRILAPAAPSWHARWRGPADAAKTPDCSSKTTGSLRCRICDD